MSRPGWWGRNRRAVIALPVLLVLAMAANGQRLVQYWWPASPREATAVRPGGWTTLSGTGRDANGPFRHTMTMRVLDTTSTNQVEEYAGDDVQSLAIPGNLRLWRITLHVVAPPEDILSGCQLAVLDEQGREYTTGVQILSDSGPSGIGYTCVPADDPGPGIAFAAGPTEPDSGLDSDTDPRPPEYDKYVYVVMPQDREPDRLRVWFELPRFSDLPLRPSAG